MCFMLHRKKYTAMISHFSSMTLKWLTVELDLDIRPKQKICYTSFNQKGLNLPKLGTQKESSCIQD